MFELGTYGVLNIDAGVNNVSASTLTSAVVVAVRRSTRRRARESGNSPRSVGLGGADRHDGILLDEVDARVVLQSLNLRRVQRRRESAEVVGEVVHMVGLGGEGRHGGRHCTGLGLGLEADDVLVGNELDVHASGLDEGRGLGAAGGRGREGRQGEEGKERWEVHLGA